MANREQKKELYRGYALASKNSFHTLLALAGVAIFILLVSFVSTFLPASWLFQGGSILISAIYINKVLKEGPFRKTYILYEDSLVAITRYGYIEKITEEFDLETSVFTSTSVTSNGKTYSFSPDNELKKLLNL